MKFRDHLGVPYGEGAESAMSNSLPVVAHHPYDCARCGLSLMNVRDADGGSYLLHPRNYCDFSDQEFELPAIELRRREEAA